MHATSRLKLLFFVLLLVGSNSSFAQHEADIIARYQHALQRSVRQDDVTTIEAMGEFEVQNLKFPATIFFKAPTHTRVEMKFQSLTFLQVRNDSVSWEYNPLEDKSTVKSVGKGESTLENGNAFDFVSKDLLNYKELNFQVKVVGKRRVDSVDVYVLEMRKDKTNAGKVKYYIDIQTSLLYKVEDAKGYRCFMNYRNYDGIVFPTRVVDSTTKEEIEMNFSEISFNKPLSDSLFMIPDRLIKQERTVSLSTADDLMDKGDESYNDEDFEEAVEYYTKALAVAPSSYRAYNSRGLAQIEREKYYEAISDFVRAMEADPSDSRAVNNLGLSKYYLGDYEGAIKDYSVAISMSPEFVIAIKNRGMAYLQLEEYEEAEKNFALAIKLSPEDGVAHLKHGNALAQLEKYKEAVNAYNLALQYQYTGADLFNYRGVSEYKLAQFENALASFEQALKRAPDNLQYLENIARTHYEMGNYSAAVEKFELYIKKQDDKPEIYNLNGLCKYQDENYKGAIKEFSKSIQLNGENAAYYDNRAAAKEMVEDYEGAISDYSQSIRLYPNDASVFYKRGLLKIYTSKKMEGCMDLATANEMKFEAAKEAILKNCH